MECEYFPSQATVLFGVTRTCLGVLMHRDVRLLVGNCIRQNHVVCYFDLESDLEENENKPLQLCCVTLM